MPSTDLTPPTVPPSAYDTAYYREACGDAAAWNDRRAVDGIYGWVVAELGLDATASLVDLGCGRGELVTGAALAGARRAVGVEYSPDALELARDTARTHGVQDRVELLQGDVRATGLADGAFDHAAMLDVVEHLTAAELHDALVEARRLLRPGGSIIVHTMPNRLVYDRTYRVLRALWPTGRRWPRDPRKRIEHEMHVGELSRRELRDALRAAGFVDVQARLGHVVWFDFVPSPGGRRVLHALDRIPPLRPWTRNDLLARAVAP
ncbi:MAG: class I SAM-dependent methyltransferase [Solirubrobacteraceae bacterium]|nr:class I SAM-dependent methyltransferase [Solirubrobacteraceae bacterium]